LLFSVMAAGGFVMLAFIVAGLPIGGQLAVLH
jgi:hypothetical protein